MSEGEYTVATSTGPTGTFGNLIGKSKGWETRLKDLEEAYKLKIENGTTYIQTLAIDLTPTQEEELKEFLFDQLDLSINEYDYQFTQLDLNLKTSVLNYVKNINALNIINSGGDGYGENGKWTVLKLSGGTDVYPVAGPGTVTPANTLEELGNDYNYLTNLITCYSQIYNGDDTGLTVGNVLNDVISAKITGPGKFGLAPPPLVGIGNQFSSPTSYALSPFLMEYYLFGLDLPDEAAVDLLVTTNIQPYKENSSSYNGPSIFNNEMINVLYPPPFVVPNWVDTFRNEVSQYIALNEDFYIRKLLDIKEEFVDKMAPQGTQTLSQGLKTLVYPTNLTDLKNDKEREMTYEQINDQTIEADLRNYASKKNQGPDSSFNLKFN